VLLFAKIQADGEMHQPGLLQILGELKGARGISIISTAVQGSLVSSAADQGEIERKLRQHRDAHKIQGFTQVVMSEDISSALDSLLQTAGLGGFGPNTVMTAWPTSWKENITGAERMIQILKSAHSFNMALMLAKGHEDWPATVSHTTPIDLWWVVHDGGLLLLLSIILRKHKKWHHCPLRVFIVCGSKDDPKQLEGVIKDFLYNMRITPARLKVVQLSDGGGHTDLTAILPTRGAEWGEKAANAKVNRNIIASPLGNLEKNTVGDQHQEESAAPTPGGGSSDEPAAAAAAMPAAPMEEQGLDPKMRTTHLFNQMVRSYSLDAHPPFDPAALILCNLPLPFEGEAETKPEEYMEHLEVMMAGIPRALLVAGQKDADVITMYS